MKAVGRVAVVALAVAMMGGTAWAQGGFGAGAKTKSSASKKDAGGKKDPVAAAFALGPNVHLRGDQQTAYDKLKQEMEPKLREALAAVESASGTAEKDKAAKHVMAIRKEIRTKIAQILSKADPAAAKQAQDAARAAQKARQQQQQRMKQQQKKRH